MQKYEWRLLCEYRTNGSERAFTQLTERYLRIIYSASLRELGDRCLAEDVTQAVLIIFVRKIDTIRPDTKLAGWFYQTAKYVAQNERRRERKRRDTEQLAGAEIIDAQHQASVAQWQQGGPLNSALSRLGAVDREAVLLYYCEGRTMQEVGSALGVSEAAAKMRVSRAIGKLRLQLSREHVYVSTAVLAILLAAYAPPADATPLIGNACRDAFGPMRVDPPNRPVHLAQGAITAMNKSRIRLAATLSAATILSVAAFLTTGGSVHAVARAGGNVKASPTARLSDGAPAPSTSPAGQTPATAPAKQPVIQYYVCDYCKCVYTPAVAKQLGYHDGPGDMHWMRGVAEIPAGYRFGMY